MSDGERFLLKDLFDEESIGTIATAVAHAHPPFDAGAFAAAVFDERWGSRELKQRMRHVASTLHSFLPGDYREALGVLVAASPATVGAGFAAMALSDFVEAFGVDDPDASIPALETFTKVVSAEFAVRPFIDRYPERMWPVLLRWARSDDPAVRRLASEGSRPRLPWGMRLHALVADPRPLHPILAALLHDSSEDVRRSVANNLNDVAKDHPRLVVEWLTAWQDDSAEVEEITRHGLRTLVKRGDRDALRLLGFDPRPRVEVEGLAVLPPSVPIGGSVRLACTVVSLADTPQPVVVDAVVHFVKSNGSLSPKVFKVRTAELESKGRLDVQRTFSLAQMSTRTVYPGTHVVEIQVNGAVQGRADFEVTENADRRAGESPT